MSFNTIRENYILAKISKFTVLDYPSVLTCFGCPKEHFKHCSRKNKNNFWSTLLSRGLEITPDRWQSKTLSIIDERRSKIDRNNVFNCHLSPVGDKWQSKTLFLLIFDLRSSISTCSNISRDWACPICFLEGSVKVFLIKTQRF